MKEKSSRKALQVVAALWQVCLKKLHPDILIQGSPERSLFRVVPEEINGSFFVLEQNPEKNMEHKRRIAADPDGRTD